MNDGTLWSHTVEVIGHARPRASRADHWRGHSSTCPHRAARRGHRDPRADCAYPMESGYRADARRPHRAGQTSFAASLRANDDELVFSAELFPAIASNPYLGIFHGRHGQRRAQLYLGRRPRFSRKRRLSIWPSHEACAVRRWADHRVCQRRPSPTRAARALISWRPRRRPCSATTRRTPGMLWVSEGEELWGRRFGVSNRSCASCHGDAVTSMAGVAARYPAFDALEGRAVDLGARHSALPCAQPNGHMPFRAPRATTC